MLNFESKLFEIAPWSKEVMLIVKEMNEQSLMDGRSGWVNRGINPAESIYEHSCKVALAAHYLFGTQEAINMGLVHDFAEVYVKDYIPGEISDEEKKQEELKAIKQVTNELPNGEYWYTLWNNFENKEGIGKQIFELDKICPTIQAIDYLENYRGHNLEEFYSYAREKIETPELQTLLDKNCLRRFPISGGSAYEFYFEGLKKINL